QRRKGTKKNPPWCLGAFVLKGLLEVFVSRPAAAFGGDPADDVVGVHDVAGLAVNAIREVDLETARIPVVLADPLVDRRGTEVLAGISEFLRAALHADLGIEHV